jgi:hypothetical protein
MYDFPFLVDGSQASGRVSGERVSFSSYPGVVASLVKQLPWLKLMVSSMLYFCDLFPG